MKPFLFISPPQLLGNSRVFSSSSSDLNDGNISGEKQLFHPPLHLFFDISKFSPPSYSDFTLSTSAWYFSCHFPPVLTSNGNWISHIPSPAPFLAITYRWVIWFVEIPLFTPILPKIFCSRSITKARQNLLIKF